MIKGFTSRYGVIRLIRYAVADPMEAATVCEKKKWNRDWTLALIERDDPDRSDLAIAWELPRMVPAPSGVTSD